jgi:hypothetical protein
VLQVLAGCGNQKGFVRQYGRQQGTLKEVGRRLVPGVRKIKGRWCSRQGREGCVHAAHAWTQERVAHEPVQTVVHNPE